MGAPQKRVSVDFSPQQLFVAGLFGRQYRGLPADVLVLEIPGPLDVGGQLTLPAFFEVDGIALTSAHSQVSALRLTDDNLGYVFIPCLQFGLGGFYLTGCLFALILGLQREPAARAVGNSHRRTQASPGWAPKQTGRNLPRNRVGKHLFPLIVARQLLLDYQGQLLPGSQPARRGGTVG